MEYIIRYVFAYAIHRIASIFCMPYACAEIDCKMFCVRSALGICFANGAGELIHRLLLFMISTQSKCSFFIEFSSMNDWQSNNASNISTPPPSGCVCELHISVRDLSTNSKLTNAITNSQTFLLSAFIASFRLPII